MVWSLLRLNHLLPVKDYLVCTLDSPGCRFIRRKVLLVSLPTNFFFNKNQGDVRRRPFVLITNKLLTLFPRPGSFVARDYDREDFDPDGQTFDRRDGWI